MEDETDLQRAGPKVVQQLGFDMLAEPLARLVLDEHLRLHHHVGSVTPDDFALEMDIHGNLALHAQSPPTERYVHGARVDRLEKSESQLEMDLIEHTDNRLGEVGV